MSGKRILRDGSILALLCAGLYIAATAFDGFAKAQDGVYSQDRRLADAHFAERQWEKASFHYQKLVERDPFNGFASFQFAVCQLGLRAETIDELKDKQASGSDAELVELELKLEQIEDRVIDSLTRAGEFLRHRRRALVNLAIVHTGRKEWEEAMDILETYIEEGNFLTRSIEYISGLGNGGRQKVNEANDDQSEVGLHQFPRFWNLVERENRKRQGRELPVKNSSDSAWPVIVPTF